MRKLALVALMGVVLLTGCAHRVTPYDIKAMTSYELCSTVNRHRRDKITKQLLQNEVNHRSRVKGEAWRERCSIIATNKVKYLKEL